MDIAIPPMCCGVVDTQYAYRVCTCPAPGPAVLSATQSPFDRRFRHTQPGESAERDSVILSGMAELRSVEHVDVLIVGAGLSGVGAGCHLTMSWPGKSFAILEARAEIGGTWDLFRYPGIRSDSDMFTLGYNFHPWKQPKTIADGGAIRAYINETADEYACRAAVRLHHRAVRAERPSQAPPRARRGVLGSGEVDGRGGARPHRGELPDDVQLLVRGHGLLPLRQRVHA